MSILKIGKLIAVILIYSDELRLVYFPHSVIPEKKNCLVVGHRRSDLCSAILRYKVYLHVKANRSMVVVPEVVRILDGTIRNFNLELGGIVIIALVGVVSFSVKTTPGSAGECKKALASSIERSEKRSTTLLLSRKLILDKQRPFTGCGASDASDRFFSAS